MSNSGGGTICGYAVEVRSNRKPVKVVGIGDIIVGTEWQKLEFSQAPVGIDVSNDRFHEPWLSIVGLHSYPAAEALRYWFIAGNSNRWSLETRLVVYEVKFSYDTTRKGVGLTRDHIELWGMERLKEGKA